MFLELLAMQQLPFPATIPVEQHPVLEPGWCGLSCGQTPVAPEMILGSWSALYTYAHPRDREDRPLLCFRLALPYL